MLYAPVSDETFILDHTSGLLDVNIKSTCC